MSQPPTALGALEHLLRAHRAARTALDGFRVVASREGHLLEGALATLAEAERLYRETHHQVEIAQRSLQMAYEMSEQLNARLAHANTVMSRNITKE